ncbi:receptor accessory protein 4 [Mortierella sp. 14UC]|nr:receptor accessory protein 4 [Mortierella sp. 14UC]
MPKSPAPSLQTLPTELIINIFILSSNPALALTSRSLSYSLAPLAKSNSTRTRFLLTRYRHNYVKAVVKGLRWAFFDIDLLNALDHVYARDLSRVAEEAARQELLLHSHQDAIESPVRFHAWEISTASPIGQLADSASISSSGSPTPTAPTPSKRAAPIEAEDSSNKKRRRKYPLPLPAVTDTPSSLIPLPKDFPIPRRLFKSHNYIPLLRALLSRGGSPSHTSHYPLVRACQRGDVEMVKMLLSFGAPAEMKALRWACVEEHNDIVDVFLEYGVKPDDQCLSWCVEKGKSKMIDRLLKLGVVPNLKTGSIMMYLVSRVVCSVAGSLYPAYASYKAIHTRDNNRLTAWLMYWTVMGMFSVAEFVLDIFVFWLPFYYEIKMLFVLWMILPQTQGSIYIYQAIVDPYLSKHEKEIDLALKDMKNKAMAMGMQYLKQAIQAIQNFALDMYKKSQAPTSVSSFSAAEKNQPSADRSVPPSYAPTHESTSLQPPERGYFSWVYSVMSPKLTTVATMASETVVRNIPSRPLPQPLVNLYNERTQSTGSTSSRDSSTAGNVDNILGIISAASTPSADKSDLDNLTSRLNRAAAHSTGFDSTGGSLRNRKISLYDDEPSEDDASPSTTGQHTADNSWSSYAGFRRTTSVSNDQ